MNNTNRTLSLVLFMFIAYYSEHGQTKIIIDNIILKAKDLLLANRISNRYYFFFPTTKRERKVLIHTGTRYTRFDERKMKRKKDLLR